MMTAIAVEENCFHYYITRSEQLLVSVTVLSRVAWEGSEGSSGK